MNAKTNDVIAFELATWATGGVNEFNGKSLDIITNWSRAIKNALDAKDTSHLSVLSEVRKEVTRLKTMSVTELAAEHSNLMEYFDQLERKIQRLKAEIVGLKAEIERLRDIAKQCLEDDEENNMSVELNHAGKWMLHFLNGGKFPS